MPVCLPKGGKYSSASCRNVPILFGMWGISQLNFHFADDVGLFVILNRPGPILLQQYGEGMWGKNDRVQTFARKWYE